MVSVNSSLQASQDQFFLPALALLSEQDAARVRTALAYAAEHGAGQVLDTREPALSHMLAVADLLAELRTDADTRIAGILAPLSFFDKHLEKRAEALFDKEVVHMLFSLRQLYKLRTVVGAHADANLTTAKWADQVETLRKMMLAMASDVRVVLIRLCSRLQTLRHFSGLDDIKAQRGDLWKVAQYTARESLDLYAPLANRLGLWQIKWEMEDLSFRLLEPDTYKRIAKMLDEKRTEREAFINQAMETIREHLEALGIHAEISGRPKHIYSIWNKMRGKGLTFDQLYDVRACRVIVDDVKSCYTALGVVHELWTPLSKEFDDYIAKPKPNGYQSLHTVVTDRSGKTLEVQIRTHDMHSFAEYGVAAHWRYKESGKAGYAGNSRADGDFENRIAWLRQLLAWKNEVTDTMAEPSAWTDKLKSTVLEGTVYVFTPQARVIELPAGSTPVDFAYHLHSELGHKCRGAKVDGAMVPLNTPLQSGQTVEVITVRGDGPAGPSRDWLNSQLGYLMSHRAKQKVRQWFAQQELKETIERGRSIVEKELQRIGHTAMSHEVLAARLGYPGSPELYGAMAREEIRPRAIEHCLAPPPAATEVDSPDVRILNRRKTGGDAANESGVLVVGVDALMTQLARCCRPTPPDPIIGFVTRGKGISIHRVGCPNLTSMARNQSERLIETTWGEEGERVYPVDLIVMANDRQGLLRDITEVFSREKINVIGVNTQSQRNMAKMQFTAEVKHAAQLQRALTLLMEINGVFEARRR